jgi:hypothetical protein
MQPAGAWRLTPGQCGARIAPNAIVRLGMVLTIQIVAKHNHGESCEARTCLLVAS